MPAPLLLDLTHTCHTRARTGVQRVARYPSYLHELLRFDGIAANSETSRDTLREFWRWAGVSAAPPVEAITLGVETKCHPLGDTSSVDVQPVVLCVGTLEGRKNHFALLEACEALWARGVKFELRLIGLVN